MSNLSSFKSENLRTEQPLPPEPLKPCFCCTVEDSSFFKLVNISFILTALLGLFTGIVLISVFAQLLLSIVVLSISVIYLSTAILALAKFAFTLKHRLKFHVWQAICHIIFSLCLIMGFAAYIIYFLISKLSEGQDAGSSAVIMYEICLLLLLALPVLLLNFYWSCLYYLAVRPDDSSVTASEYSIKGAISVALTNSNTGGYRS